MKMYDLMPKARGWGSFKDFKLIRLQAYQLSYFFKYIQFYKIQGGIYIMKKVISIFVAVTMIFSSITTAFATDFSDINGHWAESTINKWKDKEIITGYPDGTFKPDDPVTRAELAKILTEAFELKEKTSLEEYDDMDSSSWYYPYVQCSEKYIPVYPLAENYPSNMPYIENQEHSGTTFGFLPEVDAIRVHVAEALVEIKKEKENITIELPSTIQDIKYSVKETFPNDPAYDLGLGVPGGGIAGNVARMTEYTYIANKLGIMTGDENGFRPYDKITRAELITVIDRMLSESI